MMRRGLLIGSLGLGTVLAGGMISAFCNWQHDKARSRDVRRIRRPAGRERPHRRHGIHPRRHIPDGLRAPSA